MKLTNKTNSNNSTSISSISTLLYQKYNLFIKKINSFASEHSSIPYSVFFLYIILLSIISYFHEPWGDEAQAWVIARDVSIHDMIFEIGHLEGHPPLWWIYLSIFAKNGLNYEFGLKLAAIIINSLSAYLIIFQAPFHKIANYTIPFTYFLFYQYGVISRCYSFLILGLILCAIYYNTKNDHPFKMVLSMILCCLSSAYGMILMFGIAIIWLYELLYPFIKREKNFIAIIKNKIFSFISLFLLLIIAVATLLLIIPYPNTSGMYLDNNNSYLFRLFYCLLLLPVDSLVTTSYLGETNIGSYDIPISTFILGAFLWILILSMLLTRKEAIGKKKLLLIPYVFFSISCSKLYVYSHHIGIFALFLLFWLWTCFDSPKTVTRSENTPKYISWLVSGDGILLYNMEWILFSYILIVSLSWSVTSSFQDIKHNYVSSREIYNYLESNNLTNASIMFPGTYYTINGTEYYEPHISSSPCLTAYLTCNNNVYRSFFKNYYSNWTVRTIYESSNDPQLKEIISDWQSKGYPDIILDDCDLSLIYDNDYQLSNSRIPKYVCVLEIPYCPIYKGFYFSSGDFGKSKMYIREDLFNLIN